MSRPSSRWRADPRPRRSRRHLAARPIPRRRARRLGHCRLLALADAVLARMPSDAMLVAGAIAGVVLGAARDARHARAPSAHRAVRPLPVLRLRRPAVHELPVGPAAARERASSRSSSRAARASSSGSTASCCSASCFSPGVGQARSRATRRGSSSRRSTITSGRSRCRRRSRGTRRNSRIGCSPAHRPRARHRALPWCPDLPAAPAAHARRRPGDRVPDRRSCSPATTIGSTC